MGRARIVVRSGLIPDFFNFFVSTVLCSKTFPLPDGNPGAPDSSSRTDAPSRCRERWGVFFFFFFLLFSYCLTSLEALETNGNISMCTDAPIRLAEATAGCRHAGVHKPHQRERAAIIAMLENSREECLNKRSRRLTECAMWPTIRKNGDGSPGLCLGRCKDRLCPLCSRIRGLECTEKITELVKRMNSPRFLTLTVKNSDVPLRAQVNRLFECFKDFRKRKSWKGHVVGGVYSLEVTWNQRDQTWHPHLHLIIDGHYWTQKEISSEWLDVTGDSSICHIVKVNDAQRTAKYVSAYVNTPPEISEWPESRGEEYALAMHGRRVLHAFGCCHGSNVDPEPEPEEAPKSEHVCAVATLRKRVKAGCEVARTAMDLMHSLGGFWSMIARPSAHDRVPLRSVVSDESKREFVRLCERVCELEELEAAGVDITPQVERPPDPCLIDVARESGRRRKR